MTATAGDRTTGPELSERHVVHVVQFSLDAVDDHEELTEVLDEHELSRSRLIAEEGRRKRFEAAHAFMRIVLGRHLRVRPETITFSRGPAGKPAIVGAADLQFNLSHSGAHAVLAVSHGREVGVDIEQVRPVDVSSLARRFFSRGEADALQELSGDRQLRSFFRCWTRKESLVKAMGDGLGFPLNAFEAGLQETGEIVVYPTPADQQTCWTVSDISTFPGYAAALTVAGSGLQIEQGLWRSA